MGVTLVNPRTTVRDRVLGVGGTSSTTTPQLSFSHISQRKPHHTHRTYRTSHHGGGDEGGLLAEGLANLAHPHGGHAGGHVARRGADDGGGLLYLVTNI